MNSPALQRGEIKVLSELLWGLQPHVLVIHFAGLKTPLTKINQAIFHDLKILAIRE